MRGIILLFTVTIFFSCGEVKRLDTSKVKQIRPDEMMTKVRSMGEATQALLQDVGPCNKSEPKIDSLSKELKATITLVNIDSIEVSRIKDAKEQMLYDAYQYAAEQKEALPSNAQKLEKGDFVYTFGSMSTIDSCKAQGDSSRYFWELRWTQANLLQAF